MIQNPHTFHIPVMGLAFTIDTPVKVARFGISSVVSIISDTLVEQMREYYSGYAQETYVPIPKSEDNYREKRICRYLNLLNRIVQQQTEQIKKQQFGTGSELDIYFEMLPDSHNLKQAYQNMIQTRDTTLKSSQQSYLLEQVKPGKIDVNIMTKVDQDRKTKAGETIENGSDALTALKGYADSDLVNSSIIFSAGMNPRLFNYLEQFSQFSTIKNGTFEKTLIIKVSDYRSAIIQGKYLAKKGLWVSEFRVESGLNCGGHAFATDGYLIGPILEEFKKKRNEMVSELFDMYCIGLQSKGKPAPPEAPQQRVTFQGGIGNHMEDELLRNYYELDGTGWGSPFLLVPEATTVDKETLLKLCRANENDIVLSYNSPLGVRFNYLRDSSGENEKHERIAKGKPGSPCTEKFLVSNTEFTDKPLCTASATYQKLKMKHIESGNVSDEEKEKQRNRVLDKECLCIGLCNSVIQTHNAKPILKTSSGVSMCPGPNLAYFSKIVSLREMVDHIYGRANILGRGYRPHFFIKEMNLYIDYLKEQLTESAGKLDKKAERYFRTFAKNMTDGISYYKQLVEDKMQAAILEKENMKRELMQAEEQLKSMITFYTQKLDWMMA